MRDYANPQGGSTVKMLIRGLMALGRHRLFQVAASLTIGAILLWLALAKIDVASLSARLRQVQLPWLALAMLVYWCALALRSWRWRIILAPACRLSFGQVFHGLIIGYAANNVLPARLGELLRADFLGRRYGIPRLSVIGTIVVERLFDVVVFIGFIFAGLAALHSRQDIRIAPILHAVEILAVGCVLLAAVLIILVNVRHKSLPTSLAFLEAHLKSLTDGLHRITGAAEVAVLAAATAIVWAVDSLSVWLLCRALGIDPGLLPLLLIMGMSCLAALIPAAPANIGALQVALVLAFELLGYDPDAGFGLSLLVQGCFIVSSTLVGGALYVMAGVTGAAARPER